MAKPLPSSLPTIATAISPSAPVTRSSSKSATPVSSCPRRSPRTTPYDAATRKQRAIPAASRARILSTCARDLVYPQRPLLHSVVYPRQVLSVPHNIYQAIDLKHFRQFGRTRRRAEAYVDFKIRFPARDGGIYSGAAGSKPDRR